MNLRTRLDRLQAALNAKREANRPPRHIVVLPGKRDLRETEGEAGERALACETSRHMTEPDVSRMGNSCIVITPPEWTREQVAKWTKANLNIHPEE